MEKFHHILNTLINLLGEMSPYILLGFLIAGIMHAFVPSRVMSRHLSGKGSKAVFKSALFGVPLPLCSCGVLPTAISLRRGGASRAATTSFLVATPQTGVDSIAATWSLLGPAFAVIRPIAAFFTAMVAGTAVGKFEKEDDSLAEKGFSKEAEDKKATFFDKTGKAFKYGFGDLIDSIGGWLTAGLLIAALITVFVPSNFFGLSAEYPLFAMITVVIVAIPMYVCATGSIPIALSLMMAGLSPGTALVLLMAGPAANFASFTLISKELGRKSALIYIMSIVVCSIVFGLVIDKLLPAAWFMPKMSAEMHCHTANLSLLEILSSIVLLVLIVGSFIKKIYIRTQNKTKMENYNNDATVTYKVTGMNCSHCQASVVKALEQVAGVTEVSVNLSSGLAKVMGNHSSDDAIRNVTEAGFDIEVVAPC